MWKLIFMICSLNSGEFTCTEAAKNNAETVSLEMYEADSAKTCMQQSIAALGSWARLQTREFQIMNWHCEDTKKE